MGFGGGIGMGGPDVLEAVPGPVPGAAAGQPASPAAAATEDVVVAQPAELSGRMAITVTFNHAIIALGSDYGARDAMPAAMLPFTLKPAVPGRTRWVTTSVARFDPDQDWPAELQLVMTLRPDITSIDGAKLERGAQVQWNFATPLLRMWVNSVHSQRALNLTAGRWSASTTGEDTPEVPPDGRVQLRFSSIVDQSVLQTALQLRSVAPGKKNGDAAQGGKLVPFQLGPCEEMEFRPEPDAGCVVLTLKGDLEVDGNYELVLPTGSSFHPRAGQVSHSLSAGLHGLHRLTFPLIGSRPGDEHLIFTPRYRRHRLWLRHGLADGATVNALVPQFKLTPHVQFTLTRPELGVLQLEAPFEPDTEYEVEIQANAAIHDGFGLPLEASRCRFRTAKLESFLLEPGGSPWATEEAIFTPSNASELPAWPLLARGEDLCLDQGCRTGAQLVGIAPITAQDVRAAIAELRNPSADYTPLKFTQAATAPLKPQVASLELPLAKLLQPTGLALRSRYVRRPYEHSPKRFSALVGAPTLLAVFASAPDGTLMVLVLRASDNTVVPDATVTVYGTQCWKCQASDVVQKATGMTNEDGLARLQVGHDDHRLAVVVEAKGEPLLLHTEVPSAAQQRPPRSKAKILSDRSVYKPADVVKVKGYIRYQAGTQLSLQPPSARSYSLNVRWNRRGKATEVPVTVDKTFGSFSAELQIPPGAQYGHTLVRLFEKYDGPSCYQGVCTESLTILRFVIADPRPPTAELTVKLSKQVLPPGGQLPVSISTATLSGVPVPDADVKLTWRLRPGRPHAPGGPRPGPYLAEEDFGGGAPMGPPLSRSSEETSGEEHVKTGEQGTVTFTWRPKNLTRPEEAGDSLSLHFEWVGPTRELLTKELHVPVALSERSVVVRGPEPRHALPGVPFKVSANVNKHPELGGGSVPKVPISIALYRVDEAAKAPEPTINRGMDSLPPQSMQEHTCATTASMESGEVTCMVTLPRIGRFLVTACTGPQGAGDPVPAVCSSTIVGRTRAEWEAEPLTDYLEAIAVTADRPKYTVGEKPRIQFHNPATGMRVLLAWGNRVQHRTLLSSKLPVGDADVELPPLGSECEDGCQLWAVLCVPRDASRTAPVPTSILLDLQGPHSAMQELTLNVEPKSPRELTLSLQPDKPVQTPGSKAGFTVQLQNKDGTPARGEVCVFAVDRAFLNLQPHDPVHLAKELVPSTRSEGLRFSHSHEHLVSSRGLLFTAEAMKKLLDADPWLLDANSQWPLDPKAYHIAMLNLTEMLQSHTDRLTELPWPAWGGGDAPIYGAGADEAAMAVPVPAPMMKLRSSVGSAGMHAQAMAMESAEVSADDNGGRGGGGAGRSGSPFGHLQVRSNFVVTPLFLPAQVVEDGTAHIEWKLPDNTGAFELRAYAVSEDGQSSGGAATAEQVVRRDVSLSPSMPRLARVGDAFSGGVSLTTSKEFAAGPVEIFVQVEGDAALLQEAAVVSPLLSGGGKTLTTSVDHVGPGDTVPVSFPMKAAAVGNVTIRVKLARGETTWDALEMTLEVMGTQPEVYLATSVAIEASQPPAMPWAEGLSLPPAEKGSGRLMLAIGAGRRPAVESLAAGLLLQATSRGAMRSASSLLCAVAVPALLAQYHAGNEGGNVQPLPNAEAELAALTRPGMGLRYSANVQGSHPDLRLNAFALYALRRLQLAGVSLPDSFRQLTGTWRDALETGLVSYAQRMLQASPSVGFRDFETLAACRLALGSAWHPRNANDGAIEEALSLQSLLHAAGSLSTFSKASVLLLLLLPDQPDRDSPEALKRTSAMLSEAQPIIKALYSCLRIAARSAYIAEDCNNHAAGLRANGAVLSALALARLQGATDLVNVDKLANYVAQGGGEASGSADVSLLAAAFGLADYDLASKNTNPDVRFSTLIGTTQLFATTLAESLPADTFETSWDKLPQLPGPMPPVLFKAEGVGEVSVAVALRFVPPGLQTTPPVYRGVDVQKVIQRYDALSAGPVGPALDKVPVGGLVTVTLQITTPDDIRGLVVEDWLPAGLEALDPELQGGGAPKRDVGSFIDCPSWMWYSCTSFDRETKKDRVAFYSAWVFAGTHTVSYEALAATPGAFLLPPAHGYATLEPELMGRSGSGLLHVERNAQWEETRTSNSSATPAAVKHCPGDCMGRGTCDGSTGQCQCNPGSTGADCSQAVGLPKLLPLTGAVRDGRLVAKGGLEDVLELVAGAAEEVLLSVQLITEGAAKAIGATWLFASSNTSAATTTIAPAGDASTLAPTVAKAPVSVRVVQDKQQLVVGVPKAIATAAAADVTVTASTDGHFFASRRLSVQLYPVCVPGTQRACTCTGEASTVGEDDRVARQQGNQSCAAGGAAFGPCLCKQLEGVHRNDGEGSGGTAVGTQDAGSLGTMPAWLTVLVVLCIAAACYRSMCRPKHTARQSGGHLPLFGGGGLGGMGSTSGTTPSELAALRGTALMRNRSSGSEYVDIADSAE